MAFVNEQKEDGAWHTIDRERDIILENPSGQGDSRYRCELIFKGKMVRFEALLKDRVHGKPELGKDVQYEMNWTIYQIYSGDFQDKNEEIRSSIKEALTEWGWNFKRENAAFVNVEFYDKTIGK